MPSTQPGIGSIDLDGKFSLHNALQQLRPLWDGRQLAFVHAVGSPDTSRSHFDAQAFMESGTAGMRTPDGWLNRTLPRASQNVSPLRGVAIGATLPLALRGDRGAVAVDDREIPGRRRFVGDSGTPVRRKLGPAVESQGGGTFDAMRRIEAIRQQTYTPTNGVFYQGEFGRRLQQLARLIKADVGVEVAFVDLDGWDHHANEAALEPAESVRQRPVGVHPRSRRPHGGCGHRHDVGVRRAPPPRTATAARITGTVA